jgi:LysM repeat protein
MLTLVVPAWAVVIDGKIAAGLPSRALAEQTVRALRSRSAGSLQVRQAKVPVAQYHRTAAEALRALAGGAAGTATYAVKDGDSAWIIADRLHTSVEELQLLNPGVDLENLQIGQQLRVARQGAPPNTPR